MTLSSYILLCSVVLLSSAVPHHWRTDNREQDQRSNVFTLSSVGILENKIPRLARFSAVDLERRTFIIRSSYFKDGLTLDGCKEDFDCEGLRLCYGVANGGVELCKGSKDCFCRPVQLEMCQTSTDCINGEVCVETDAIRETICVSKDKEEQFSNINEVSGTPSGPSATPYQTSEMATSSTPSANPSASPEASPVSRPSMNPTTGPADSTASTSPSSGASLAASSAPGSSQFVQATPLTTPSQPPEELGTPVPSDSACVDARALAHMDSADLVYCRHQRTTVLCDANESCATPGHIVKFKGKAMMMVTFCHMVGCEKRSMHVNSPRYKRGVLINSSTVGLQYTAFAARYGSRLEEVVISVVVRMGM